MSTTVLEQPTLWTSMPGWGIAADLIPPELINSRKLKSLRKLMAAGVVFLVVVGAGGYYLAVKEKDGAAADLTSVQDQTTQLQREGAGYSGVIAIQGSVSKVRTQIAQVMTGDVDLVALVGQLTGALPATMTIGQVAITISPAAIAVAAPGGGLDMSGLPRIGTITMSGTGQSLSDLSDYIDALKVIPGLVDVLPVSNTVSETVTQYNITIGLTNVLLSHRFDVGAR